MDEDFFSSTELNDKKSAIKSSKAKKLSHNIVDIEMDKENYFKNVSNVILNKNNRYRNKVGLSIQSDEVPTFDRRKTLFYKDRKIDELNKLDKY